MSWWKSLISRRSPDSQLDSELRFHIDQLTAENIAAGMSSEKARREAILAFGGREQIKEDLRDVYRISLLDTTVANFRSAFRFMRKSPTFSLAVILTLALAIGANSAVFSAIDTILLRPLPYPDGDRLMRLEQFNPKVQSPTTFVAPVRLEDWNRLNSTFQALTGFYTEDSSETSGNLPQKVTRAWTAPRFFQVWGVSPALGREFSKDEEIHGGTAAVVISDRLWRTRFAASPEVIGKNLRVDNYSLSIIGVMPASFLFPVREVDLWSPIQTDSPYAQDRHSTWYTVIGRLKPGVTLDQARADLATAQSQLGRQFPQTDADLAVGVTPLKEMTVRGVRKSLWLLYASVSLLLLIACTNIVALLLARAAQRQHEISIRFSLGAPRSALVAQLLTETFVLVFFGAGIGLFLANATSRLFRVLGGDLPRLDEIHLDARILLYSLACSVVVTLLCGLIPAVRSTRQNLSASLSQVSRTQVSGRQPLQWLLVGIQVALAVTLLSGAGLLLRSFQALGQVAPGFEPTHVLTLHISANWGETADMKGLTQRVDRTIDALLHLPGVEASATAGALPGIPSKFQIEVKMAEGPVDPEHKILADTRFVSPGYFAALQIPLLEGEVCRQRPFPDPAPQALVNRSFVDTYLAGASAVGRHVQFADNPFALPAGAITGVVADAREQGLNHAPGPTVYWCMSAPMPDPYYLIRTHAQPMTLAQAAREKIREIEPARSVFAVMPLTDHLDDAFAENRLRAVLLSFFAATAIVLACIGLYGTLNYSVTLRRREVGLRLALGAARAQIIRQFLLQGVVVCFAGCVAGAALAAASSRLIASMLFGVSPSDAFTFSFVIVVVLAVAALASWVPAFRASRLDPMRVLHYE